MSNKMPSNPLKLCIWVETFEELKIVESATMVYFTEEGSDKIGFPVVYFYDNSPLGVSGSPDYDMFSYDNGTPRYSSIQDFKEKIYNDLLKDNPELIEMTVEELQRDYPEYLI